MKLKFPIVLALSVAFCVFSFSPAMADDHDGACIFDGTPLSPAQIDNLVEKDGFHVSKGFKEYFEKSTKLDDCVYKVKATDKADQNWKLYFDPVSGKLIGKKPKDD